uniref:DUF4485 domain-containing protein n=1 Tax=Ascaris lumbricoides TaxID=6252 RepID=A0A0M3IVH4_ASCLU
LNNFQVQTGCLGGRQESFAPCRSRLSANHPQEGSSRDSQLPGKGIVKEQTDACTVSGLQSILCYSGVENESIWSGLDDEKRKLQNLKDRINEESKYSRELLQIMVVSITTSQKQYDCQTWKMQRLKVAIPIVQLTFMEEHSATAAGDSEQRRTSPLGEGTFREDVRSKNSRLPMRELLQIMVVSMTTSQKQYDCQTWKMQRLKVAIPIVQLTFMEERSATATGDSGQRLSAPLGEGTFREGSRSKSSGLPMRLHHLTVSNCSETEDQNRNDAVEPNAVCSKEMVMMEVERLVKRLWKDRKFFCEYLQSLSELGDDIFILHDDTFI